MRTVPEPLHTRTMSSRRTEDKTLNTLTGMHLPDPLSTLVECTIYRSRDGESATNDRADTDEEARE